MTKQYWMFCFFNSALEAQAKAYAEQNAMPWCTSPLGFLLELSGIPGMESLTPEQKVAAVNNNNVILCPQGKMWYEEKGTDGTMRKRSCVRVAGHIDLEQGALNGVQLTTVFQLVLDLNLGHFGMKTNRVSDGTEINRHSYPVLKFGVAADAIPVTMEVLQTLGKLQTLNGHLPKSTVGKYYTNDLPSREEWIAGGNTGPRLDLFNVDLHDSAPSGMLFLIDQELNAARNENGVDWYRCEAAIPYNVVFKPNSGAVGRASAQTISLQSLAGVPLIGLDKVTPVPTTVTPGVANTMPPARTPANTPVPPVSSNGKQPLTAASGPKLPE